MSARRRRARPDTSWHGPPPGDGQAVKLALLQDSLTVAVPLWVAQHAGATERHLRARLAACAPTITYGATSGEVADGADVLYRSAKPGGTAHAFNRLAESIGLLLLLAGPADRDGAPIHLDVFGLRFRLSGDRRGCEVTEAKAGAA